MASLPTQLSSTCDSVKNNSLLNYHVEGPFVPVGNTNRDKRVLLSRLVTNRDKRVTLLSGLVLPTGIKGVGPFIPGGATNRDKRGAFCPGWWLHPGQKAPVPPLARLVFGPGTKATFCPGPKDNRDKWPVTKAYSVVVDVNIEIVSIIQRSQNILFPWSCRVDYCKHYFLLR